MPSGARPQELEAISRALRAELETHRRESEQALRRELELFRESITSEIKQELRFPRRRPSQSDAGPVEIPAQQAAAPKLLLTEETTAPTTAADPAEADRPLLVSAGSSKNSLTEAAHSPNLFVRTVASPKFDNMASFLVLLSVIFLAVQTDYMARHFLAEPPFIFKSIEIAFCVTFSAEIISRLLVFGKAFWTDKNKYWNFFDLSLVSMQVTEVVVATLGSGQRLPFAPFLRVLRVARMVRVARFLRQVPEFRTLIVQIFHSFLPLTWVFILVFLVTAVFAVVLTQVVTDFKVQMEKDEWEKDKEMQHLHQFDNLPTSMLALYQTISEGKHWGELSEPLMEINPGLALLFIGYTFFVIFAFMNVVTSHFVEEAIESAQQDERQQMLEKLEDIFGSVSDEASRTKELNESQFLSLCETHDMKEYLKHLYQRHDVSAEEVKEMKLFQILDADGSGHISTQELVQGCERLTRAPTVLDLAVFRQMCSDFFDRLSRTMEDSRTPMNSRSVA